MPYAYCLAPVAWSCSLMSSVVLCLMQHSLSVGTLLNGAPLVLRYSPYWSSACPQAFSLLELCLSSGIPLIGALLVGGSGVLQPLLSRVFSIALWDSLSGLCVSWDSLSGFPSL